MPAGMMQNRDPSMAALSQAFRSVEGTPAPTAAPQGGGDLAPILAMLGSGQMSAEALIALLTALTGMGAGGMQSMTPEMAMMGGGGGGGGMMGGAPAQAEGSIASAMGGY